MTIAVAACFPWGRLKDIRDSMPPGMFMRQAVFLASDSRFSLSNGTHDDTGKRVYQLTSDAAAVFAGDVLAAQRAVRNIQQFFQKRGPATRDPAGSVGELIAAAYREEQSRRAQGERAKMHELHILIGVCTRQGSASIVRYSSPYFRPIYLLGIEGVGWPDDVRRFKELVLTREKEAWGTGNSPGVEPDKWGMQVAMAIDDVMKQPQSPRSVGGKVQYVMISAEGIQEQAVSYTADPMSAGAWNQVTISLDQVKPFILPANAAAALLPEPELIVEHVMN